MTVSGYRRQFLALLAFLLGRAAAVARKEGDRLKKSVLTTPEMMPPSEPGRAGAFLRIDGVPSFLSVVLLHTSPRAIVVLHAAYIAVTSSKASSALPPVFTFSNTTHTASLEVVLIQRDDWNTGNAEKLLLRTCRLNARKSSRTPSFLSPCQNSRSHPASYPSRKRGSPETSGKRILSPALKGRVQFYARNQLRSILSSGTPMTRFFTVDEKDRAPFGYRYRTSGGLFCFSP